MDMTAVFHHGKNPAFAWKDRLTILNKVFMKAASSANPELPSPRRLKHKSHPLTLFWKQVNPIHMVPLYLFQNL
jgi:hypothetical protein